MSIKIQRSDFLDKYKLGKKIDKSKNFYKAKERKTSTKVCVQIVTKTELKEQNRDIYKEIMLKRKAGMIDRVLEILDTYETETEWIIVQEYASGGSLLDKMLSLKDNKRSLSTKQMTEIIHNILEILSKLHEKGLVHGNLHPDNVYFAKKDDPSSIRLRGVIGKECLNSNWLFYAAPECFGESKENVDLKRDIWSVGVIAFQLLSGKIPFFDSRLDVLAAKISEGSIEFTKEDWTWQKEDSKAFCRHLLEVDPTKRPTAKEALTLTWMKASPQNVERAEAAKDLLRLGLQSVKAVTTLQTASAKKRVTDPEEAMQMLRQGRTGYEILADLQSIMSKEI